jgi:RES domain-containing protein
LKPALAALEFMVHLPTKISPECGLLTLEVPDALVMSYDVEFLPAGWNQLPAPASVAAFGTSWASTMHSLGLRVPSALIEQEYNVLLNPLHPEKDNIRIKRVEEFKWDERLFRKKASPRQ